nr:hypothetical protein BaRGS_013151 [Batillaria attramentaria]
MVLNKEMEKDGGSPKRVDFNERLRLREVKWDGTYRDSVTRPDNNDSTSLLTTATAPSSIYFEGGSSTLTDSRTIRETEIRFLNEHITESLQRQDRAEVLGQTEVVVEVMAVVVVLVVREEFLHEEPSVMEYQSQCRAARRRLPRT